MTRVVIHLCVLLTLGFPQIASAYVDPTSGSILLQLILGGMAGIGVVAKLYWQRCKETISHLMHRR